MIGQETLKKIESIADQIATREGCRLYDLDFAGGQGGRILRVYIDKSGGASLEDCEKVSRGMNLLLDVEDPIPGGNYYLEVSTPGIERQLRKPWHFEQSVGEKAWFRLRQNLGSLGSTEPRLLSQKQLTEVIHSCDDSGVQLQVNGQILKIPYSAIEKAHLVYEFDAGKGKKK